MFNVIIHSATSSRGIILSILFLFILASSHVCIIHNGIVTIEIEGNYYVRNIWVCW